MSDTDAVCRRCQEAVAEGADRCPHCNYDTNGHSRSRWVWGIPGFILTMSVIGAPIGIPMLYKAYKHRKRYEGDITA